MRTGIIGTKIGSTSYFNADGTMTAVTVVKVDDCVVSGIKTKQKDGYFAVQLASIDNNQKNPNINKPQKKLFSSLNILPKKIVKEFRVIEQNLLEIGASLNVNHFEKDQKIDVTGISIGKGFAGVMKRHNFGGLRASHGVSASHRSHGSTGNCQDPGRVFKGKKMAGHMGNTQVTKQNLRIMDIDINNNLIAIKGSVPGKKNTTVYLKDAIKIKK
jgi:large subunit ribosomal protein L3